MELVVLFFCNLYCKYTSYIPKTTALQYQPALILSVFNLNIYIKKCTPYAFFV